MTRRLATASLAAGAALLAVAAPALAADVDVTLTGLGGTRQFSVEDVSGAPLTALDLGTGTPTAFRTHVRDSDFLPLGAGDDGYSVTATMSNLYLQDGAGGYSYAVKVPSSALTISFGSTPLAGSGVSVGVLPSVSVGGVLSSCASLSGTLKTLLGLDALGLPLVTNTALSSLCTQLGVLGGPVATTVDGVVRDLVPTLTDVADLPSALTGATGGTFDDPSFAGVVAGDTDGAAGAAPATAVPLMTGTHNLSAGLVTALGDALDAALAGLPLVSGTGADAVTTVEAAVAALAGSGDALTAALGAALQTLPLADQAGALNEILTTVSPLAPTLGDVTSLDGDYYAFPLLSASPSTPAPGTYRGTLTVTFVQG